MNEVDFNKLNGLLSKLENATNKAAKEDGCFRKYHSGSINSVKAMRANLKLLEHGLRTVNYSEERRIANDQADQTEQQGGIREGA